MSNRDVPSPPSHPFWEKKKEERPPCHQCHSASLYGILFTVPNKKGGKKGTHLGKIPNFPTTVFYSEKGGKRERGRGKGGKKKFFPKSLMLRVFPLRGREKKKGEAPAFRAINFFLLSPFFPGRGRGGERKRKQMDNKGKIYPINHGRGKEKKKTSNLLLPPPLGGKRGPIQFPLSLKGNAGFRHLRCTLRMINVESGEGKGGKS